MKPKVLLKNLLGELPLAAETYWQLRQPGKPLNRSFSMKKLAAGLPEWKAQAAAAAKSAAPAKNVLLFGALHYWIQHAMLLGLALGGAGHSVTLAYLPYGKWQKTLPRFDVRRQNAYAQHVLSQAAPVVNAVSWLEAGRKAANLPPEIRQAVADVSLRDTQYTLQVEEVTRDNDLYRLRMERNTQAAQAAYAYFSKNKPDVVIIPNGTILEFGVVYQVARYFGLDVVTYEFGEQQQRIWLAKNAEVMRQNTDDLWRQRGGQGLTSPEKEKIRTLFASRRGAHVWENFARRWQGVPSSGGEKVRQQLGLDERPIVLLATNVIGDSLTLGRQVFSDSMTAWLEKTVQHFAGCPQAQLVVRIHPGELVTKGPSVADVVQRALPALNTPELAHIHLIPADADVNTYDLVEIADLGLVYTTTVGMEMAMSGVPVIAVGQTHYRGKGFTLDPASWQDYFDLLDKVIAQPESVQLDQAQVELAWEYAYRFFFEYPRPFPWHLVHMWKDTLEWPLGKVLSAEGEQKFKQTFDFLAGEPVDWSAID